MGISLTEWKRSNVNNWEENELQAREESLPDSHVRRQDEMNQY